MRNAISSTLRLVVVLGVMAPCATEALTLVFELATTVGAVPTPLQQVLAPGDPIRLVFEVRSGTEDALPGRDEAALYPLGLRDIQLTVGRFTNSGAWGDLLITRGLPGVPPLDPYVSFSARRDSHHFFYGPGVGGITLSRFIVAIFEVPLSIDPGDVRGLLSLEGTGANLGLDFLDLSSGETHSLVLAIDHRFTITVDEPEVGLHLALAGLGLVGLAAVSSRVRRPRRSGLS